MEALDLEPRVVANGSAVAFALPFRNRTVECTITITTLQSFSGWDPKRFAVRGMNSAHGVRTDTIQCTDDVSQHDAPPYMAGAC
jgi:hypothetical protein